MTQALNDLRRRFYFKFTSNKMVDSLGIDDKRPLGKFSPWAWGIEPVHGCNLKCWHCSAYRIKKYQYMAKATWIKTWELIKSLTPKTRVELDIAGEPTLHPDIIEFISIARKISPQSQIQITTNGTQLINGNIKYKDLFQAGLNVAYIDMYAPKEKHIKLAQDSGYQYFEYYTDSEKSLSPWVYHDDPKIKFIALSDIPDKWPEKKIKRGGLGTMLNNLDWEKANKHGLFATEKAPDRRCSQPMKYVQVLHSGDYMFCCQDTLNEAKLGFNTRGGIEGFLAFWIGQYMQKTRRILNCKNRSGHEFCQRCKVIFSRCDVKFWDESIFDYYWDGEEWQKLGK